MDKQNQDNLNGQFLPGRKHPTTWEQNYAIVFDLTSKTIYKANRSDIDTAIHFHIALSRLLPFEEDTISLGRRRAFNSQDVKFVAKVSVNSLGLREQRLRGDIMECWVLDNAEGNARGTLVGWKFRDAFDYFDKK
ncbi:uncharacterized protein EAF01_007475 [Botrytis porri]|uniref:Uncharacterized protein n=1 Tax=Botrytis porri TaxID=87229 RepID=A0A4Z1KCN2_9HELO|nr:uncharacterized protein EAF01_007475 [Botrytis porri]KAF7902177.1 hypothetical protein EAF01_007475 [Botrytis porri]TGO83400.1 hypothetical protein BPOR_0653g00010 [Botrytis porri]